MFPHPLSTPEQVMAPSLRALKGVNFTVMEHLNWGYVQLGLLALAFGGLQVWWISSTLRTRGLAKPMSAKGFRRSLERIWAKDR